jgi:hypothetical protein
MLNEQSFTFETPGVKRRDVLWLSKGIKHEDYLPRVGAFLGLNISGTHSL